MTERIICLKCGREGHHSSTCKRKMGGYGSKFSQDAEDGIQNALLAVLSHPEGLTGVQVAIMIGLGPDSAKSKLRELHRRDEIAPGFISGNMRLWMLPSAAAAFSAAQYERLRINDAISRKRRREQRRLKDAADKAKLIEHDADLDVDRHPMVQRIIPAAAASPITPRCARWVFDVASYA